MLHAAALLFAIPAVVLSSEHESMCRVAVGDAFPELKGPKADGGEASVQELLGEKATVVAAPGGTPWMDAMLAGDLKDDFAPKYADRGVAFATLTGPALGEKIAALEIAKPELNGALGEGRGPRVYVLDSEGKVLWFDLEYTLSTHRELHAALDELLGE